MKTVLLLEDDRDLRCAICHLIEDPQVHVLEAASLAEAEQILASQRLHLLIVDGLLEDGLGLDFIEVFRRRDRTTPIVFMSAFAKDLRDLQRLTNQLNITLVCYKPIDPVDFAQKVDNVLDLYDTADLREPRTALPSLDLDMLRLDFARRLPAKVAELRDALERAEQGEGLEHAYTLAHRLRGSAGSYGYPTVSDASGFVEEALQKARDTGMAPPASLWPSMHAKLERASSEALAMPEEQSDETASEPPLLVVDDDPEFLKFVATTARTLHAPVVIARNSHEALVHARSRRIGAALLDLDLPGQEDSFQLAEALRRTRDNDNVPMGFISADRRIATRVRAMEAGAARFVEKPLPPQQLADALTKLLRAGHVDRGRVLILDHDPTSQDLYIRHLSARGYTVERLSSTEALIETLEVRPPDALLLDVDLPQVSGIDVCRALRMSEQWELLPVLLMTTHSDAATRMRAFRAGASDVIAKPVLIQELTARLDVQCELARLIRERADTDPLSGLLLRRAFMNAASAALSRCERDRTPLSLTLIDIDHFKRINDTYGHLAGDQVLAHLGEVLQRRFRTEDLKARWGGEELVLVFPGQNIEVARQATERLKDDVCEMVFTAEDGRPFSASFTAGVASYPEDGATLTELLRCADQRLYAGKRNGRDQVIARTLESRPAPT